ncbi:UDP-N-acetylglucosamine 2-epimerase (non-hydrolyzing) [Symbiobacterium terraclitae]|uniref:UDP-N-acetylglucosamine 2-epimerase (non-hydrolyzing) n=2 Tax=Symbiobacterium terraclitae TaxID=557451 RepID=A0ABS4JXP6_9FIRM|nr:UDP-N-acetylglucosamine 2-epimerase (non-hydrolyzing) [Symbiobacterium terraclitae]
MAVRRKVMAIFGSRPEGIKMAPVVQELRRHPDWFETLVVSTGQHREQLDQVFEAFGLRADHDLAIMQPRQTLTDIMVRALSGLDALLTAERPDLVLVHGDTSTTAAGALAAFYHKIPVGHVEAGLRTFDKYNPYPEEINRRMAGIIADIQFAPTPRAREHLISERVDPGTIFVTGQTGVDAALTVLRQPHEFSVPALREIDFDRHRVVVMTAHRRENLGEPMRNMFRAIRDLVERFPDVLLVYAVHLNPAVRELAWPILGGHPRILLLDPLPYPDMIHLAARSYMAMTDSGGIQEETPSLGVPHVLMRETTERPEALEAGVILLSGTSYEGVYSAGERLLTDGELHRRMARAQNPFGDGQASRRIAEYLGWRFGFLPEMPAPFDPRA